MDCDLLIVAAGFTGCQSYTANAFGVSLSKQNTVIADESYMSDHKGVFTAGDMHRGQSLVVWAIDEGRRCARAVDAYLMGYTNLDQHTAYMADGSMYAFFIKTDVNNMVRYWQKEGDFK